MLDAFVMKMLTNSSILMSYPLIPMSSVLIIPLNRFNRALRYTILRWACVFDIFFGF